MYVRSHVSNLYVTVRVAHPNTPWLLRVIQEVKYESTNVADTPRQELQRWKFTHAGADGLGGALYEISNEAYPDARLRPRDSSTLESEITLVDAAIAGGELRWRVISPVLG